MDKMRTRTSALPSILLACLVGLLVLAAAGLAQASAKQRPAVPFPHDMHLDVAEDCLSCHHDMVDGENELDEGLLMETDPEETILLDSETMGELGPVNCVTCHAPSGKAKGKANMDAMDAFHNQCIGCHETEKAGPVMCGECHIKP